MKKYVITQRCQAITLCTLLVVVLVFATPGCGTSSDGDDIQSDAGTDSSIDGGSPDAGDSQDAGEETDNLLCNPGFEDGDQDPDCWHVFPESVPTMTWSWESEVANTGSRSVSILGSGQGITMWQQVVPVTAGEVYLLYGHVGFDQVTPPGQCNLQLVFRDGNDQVIQMIDYPYHDGTRELALDFPTGLKVRAPEGAEHAEVNLYLEGQGKALFDDIYFGPATVGTISGTVTAAGSPLDGARVTILGEHWGRTYEAVTDSAGRYTIGYVPRAFPRYILLASKDGYKTRSQGRVDVVADGETTVDFQLEPGADPSDHLRVRFGDLALRRFVEPPDIPVGAVIPADPSGYPESVQAFLQADAAIESDHPDVTALAGEILAGVGDPSSTREVAWGVYEWLSRNIDHDGVYSTDESGLNTPFKDETSGIWQTISGDGRGWCWGRNMLDWTYKPHELLQVRGGICVEHALLGSALLRALNIPARPYSGSMEFWAQAPGGGDGTWIGMSTTGGRTAYREHGTLGDGFATGGLSSSFPVTAGPMMHQDWDADQPGLWRETHPSRTSYDATTVGLNQALADLDQFVLTGDAPPGQQVSPGQGSYQIHYRDITLGLYDMGEQRVLVVRFPMVSDADTSIGQGYWTNHPECVTRTWVEEIENPPVEGSERWFHIELDLSSLLD